MTLITKLHLYFWSKTLAALVLTFLSWGSETTFYNGQVPAPNEPHHCDLTWPNIKLSQQDSFRREAKKSACCVFTTETPPPPKKKKIEVTSKSKYKFWAWLYDKLYWWEESRLQFVCEADDLCQVQDLGNCPFNLARVSANLYGSVTCHIKFIIVALTGNSFA